MKLRDYLKQNGIKAAEFGTLVGVRQSVVYDWSKGKVMPRKETLKEIERATNGQVMAADFYGQKRETPASTRAIPFIDIALSAGPGTVTDAISQPNDYHDVSDWILSQLSYTNIDNLVMVSVHGNSMEPTLMNGSKVLLDTGVPQFFDGRIYALRLNGEYMIKRVRYNAHAKTIDLLSDNPTSPSYTDIPSDSLSIDGMAIWTGTSVL